MAPRSTLLAALPLLALAACSAPDLAERSAEESAPIIGGADDTFRSYVVGVGTPYDPKDSSSGPFCSGTLVSRRTVVTAGHCYTSGIGPLGGLTAVFFGADITSPLKSGAQVVGTVQVVRHPGFDATSLTNDLTLVELAADAPSQAVPLLRETLTNTPAFVGPDFTFAGYGNDGQQNYGIRRAVALPIDRVGPDTTVGLDTMTGPIDATMFYYRVALKNTCDGDSGGPAFVPRAGVERLAGATSFGDAACQIDGVQARTDAPQISAFIQAHIDQFEAMDPCRADGKCDESCNVNHRLVDPDCAPAHCGADGMCVLSCVDPPDPDCVHCGADGVCDPSCVPADVDCPPPPDAGTGGSSNGTTSSSSGGSGDAGPDAGAGGPAAHTSGCSCVVPGGEGTPGALAGALGLLALVGLSRRRAGGSPLTE